jgi:hypothetical protein
MATNTSGAIPMSSPRASSFTPAVSSAAARRFCCHLGKYRASAMA